MKANFLLFLAVLAFINCSLKAQIKVIGNGNVGIGNITNPVSLLELSDNNCLRLNSKQSTSKILFFEKGTNTSNSIQYGGELSYDGPNELLKLGTIENNIFKGIYVKRATGNTCIGGPPTTNYKLEVQGTSYLSGDIKMGSTANFPGPNVKFVSGTLQMYPILDAYPGTSTGSLGTSSQKWQTIYGMQIYSNTVLLTSDERLKENINTLDFSLSKIMKMRPVSYDFKPAVVPDDPEYKMQIEEQNEKGRNKTGFIAQELIEVIPEAVEYNEKDDSYYIDYISLIPQLVRSIQQQQVQIDELKAQIESLKKSGTR